MNTTQLVQRAVIALAVAAALAGCGGGSDATDAAASTAPTPVRTSAANVAGSVLQLTYGTQSNDLRIVVGPGAGEVEVIDNLRPAGSARYSGISAIELTAGTGDDKLVFEITQAADFDVAINTGTGNTDVQVKWIVPAGAPVVTPSVSIATGPGQKKLDVSLESFAAEVDFALTTALGAGNTEFKGQLQFKDGAVRAGANVNLGFGTGNVNKAELIVESKAGRNAFAIAGSGITEWINKVSADASGESLDLSFRPITPVAFTKTQLEVKSAARRALYDINVRGGAGADEVTLAFDQLVAASIGASLRSTLGQGNDKFEAKFTGAAGALNVGGAIVLGGGDDEAKLEAGPSSGVAVTVDCGDGIDKASGFPTSAACELN